MALGQEILARELGLLQEKFEFEYMQEKTGKVSISLLPKVDVFVDFSQFPKPPTIQIPPELEKLVGKPKNFLLSLMQWKKKAPFHVISVVEELRNYIENVSGIKLRILLRLANGLCDQAREHHPREFLGLLRVKGGVLAEYLLAPGMRSSGIAAVFSPSRLFADRSIIASVHSHPSGNARPSDQDLRMFSSGTNYFHLIIGFPYNIATMQAYDRRGNPIPIEIVDKTPFEIPGERNILDDFDDEEFDEDDLDLL